MSSRYPLRNRFGIHQTTTALLFQKDAQEKNPKQALSQSDNLHKQVLQETVGSKDLPPPPSTPSLPIRRRTAVGPKRKSPQQEQQQAPPAVVTPSSVASSSSAAAASLLLPKKNAKTQEDDSTPSKKQKKSNAVPKQYNTTPPKGWEDIYSLVEELRQDKTAPVDTDGAEALPICKDPKSPDYRFQVLIALMLSSQTKDAVVGEAMANLQQHGVLTVQSIHQMSSETLHQHIRKVGFHNNKTKYIQQTVEILRNDYNGDIPKTAQEMMELPGIGPKMAYLIETIAWGTTSGIGIDTHMHRMFNQIKWVSNTKSPEQTRLQLQAWLPQERWSTVNYLWVGFGQEVQQQKPKLLQKVLSSSRPKEALKLVQRLGLDYKKEGAKLGLEETIRQALQDK